MRTVTGFDDYELIDADSGERLERWKNIVLIRPDPQIIWKNAKNCYNRKRTDKYFYET